MSCSKTGATSIAKARAKAKELSDKAGFPEWPANNAKVHRLRDIPDLCLVIGIVP